MTLALTIAVDAGLAPGLDEGVPGLAPGLDSGLDAGLVDAVQAASVPVKVREVELSHVLLAEPVKEV